MPKHQCERRALSVVGALVLLHHVSFSGETKGNLTCTRPQRPPSRLDASRTPKMLLETNLNTYPLWDNVMLLFLQENHTQSYVALLGILNM